jgi:hypothetical protein
MINQVRNTVLSIISKENRGYITPFEFNLFAKQAQLEIFEQYIYSYSMSIVKQNARLHGEGYSDIPKKIADVIDTFYKLTALTYTVSKFTPPTDYYFVDKLIYNNSVDIEKVSQNKALKLVNSNLTAPTVAYPVYTLDETGFIVYPTTVTSNVSMGYVRYPVDPNWTYVQLTAGTDPMFDGSASDYQDFELPKSDFANLVIKILQYSGISIREADIVQAAKSEELQDAQQKQ